MLKDFIRQSGPWTLYLKKIKLQNTTKTIKNYNVVKTQINNKVIKEFYYKNSDFYKFKSE